MVYGLASVQWEDNSVARKAACWMYAVATSDKKLAEYRHKRVPTPTVRHELPAISATLPHRLNLTPASPLKSPKLTGATVAALHMIAASVFIALSTFLAKGVAGRFATPADTEDIHPLQITAARFIVGWLIWTVVIGVWRVPFEPALWPLHVVRTFFGWMTVTCIFWASSLMALADATAISFLTPVVTLFLAVFVLREQVGIVRWSAVGIMLFGAMVLLRPGTNAFQPAALIALVAALTSAFEVLCIKRLTAREPRMQILFINNSIGLVIALAAAIAVWVWPTTQQVIVLVGVGLSMALAQVFFLTSMRDGDASYVIPFMYSALIFAGALDYVVFGDSPDAIGALGAVIIVAGAVFLALREGAVKRSG